MQTKQLLTTEDEHVISITRSLRSDMLSFAYAVHRVKRAQEFSRFLLLTQNTSDVSLIRKCHVTDCWRRQESRGEHGIDISSLILILSAVQCLGAVSICLCPRAANKHAHVPAIFAQPAASQTHSQKTYLGYFGARELTAKQRLTW